MMRGEGSALRMMMIRMRKKVYLACRERKCLLVVTSAVRVCESAI